MRSNLKRIYVHGISDDEAMKKLGVASKLNADWGALIGSARPRPRNAPTTGLRQITTRSASARPSISTNRYL